MSNRNLKYEEAISILDLPHGASIDEIKSAYRRLAKQYHPDIYKLDGGERFKQISASFHFLKESPYPPSPDITSTDSSSSSGVYEEKRRTYRQRQKNKKEREAKQKAAMFEWLFSKIKPVVILILCFNILLAVDFFMQPVTEEVRISRIKTVEYLNRQTSKAKRSYSYKAILSNGNEIQFDREEIAKVRLKDPHLLERSRIFKESLKLTNKDNDKLNLLPKFGLFRVFGFLIPTTIFLAVSYFFLIKNNDHRLTTFLVILVVTILQIFLIL